MLQHGSENSCMHPNMPPAEKLRKRSESRSDKTIVSFADTLPVVHATPGAAPSQVVQPFGKMFEPSNAVPTESMTLICADIVVGKNKLLNACTWKQQSNVVSRVACVG